MRRVVFVCTGNICRSPAAHVVLEAALARAGVTGVQVESAGTHGYHQGELADPRTIAEGVRRGYDFPYRSRLLGRRDLEADLLVAMDRSHLAALTRVLGTTSPRVALFRSFDPLGGPDADVADPYYGGPDGFVEMFDVIERAMPALVDRCRVLTEP